MKFSKLRIRLEKKGNDETRRLIKQLCESAARASKTERESKATNGEATSGTASKIRVSENTRERPSQASAARVKGAKENANGPTTSLKKQTLPLATASGTGLPKPSKSAGLFDRDQKPAADSSKIRGTGAVPALATGSKSLGTGAAPVLARGVKARTTHVTAKPTSFFTDLKSASKVKPASTVSKSITSQRYV